MPCQLSTPRRCISCPPKYVLVVGDVGTIRRSGRAEATVLGWKSHPGWMSRRDTGIDHARVISRRVRGCYNGCRSACWTPLRQSSPWYSDAAPPTDTQSLERDLLTRGGTHIYCRRITQQSSSHFRPPRVGVFVLASRRCIRMSQTPCSRYHPPHSTPLKIKPFNGDSPTPVILSLAAARGGGPTSSRASAASRLCTPPYAMLVQGARLLRVMFALALSPLRRQAIASAHRRRLQGRRDCCDWRQAA